jgi:hypothetical protein
MVLFLRLLSQLQFQSLKFKDNQASCKIFSNMAIILIICHKSVTILEEGYKHVLRNMLRYKLMIWL